MRIRVKLMGMLKGQGPPGDVLDAPDQATIADVLRQLELPQNSVQVFSVNGQLERDPNRRLAADDELSVIPPVGGG